MKVIIHGHPNERKIDLNSLLQNNDVYKASKSMTDSIIRMLQISTMNIGSHELSDHNQFSSGTNSQVRYECIFNQFLLKSCSTSIIGPTDLSKLS